MLSPATSRCCQISGLTSNRLCGAWRPAVPVSRRAEWLVDCQIAERSRRLRTRCLVVAESRARRRRSPASASRPKIGPSSADEEKLMKLMTPVAVPAVLRPVGLAVMTV